MGKIVLLDNLTINQIAAGEVIERPASAVKEMVENSIDAGATNIVVEIRNGGISYIRVTDNGKGISKDDLEMAFERHATSKIRQADDLKNVKSMGFRGEALASIAAISTVEMISKTEEDVYGNRILVEAGKILETEETGASTGTTITVQNLFFNTPVRYKFLKKDYTESGYIEDVLTRLALANPNIAFRLINSGNAVLQTPGNGNIKDTIFSIYGKDVLNAIQEVDYIYDDMHITGVIGKPEIARSNRASQLFFVNKRYVRDRMLSAAAEQAYKNLLPAGKYAFLVLNIEMNPEKVDVNVHPAKLEVRFEEDNKIFQLVYSAIKNALEKGNIIKSEIDNKSLTETGNHSIANLYKKIEMENSTGGSIQDVIQNDIQEKFRKLIENLHADDNVENKSNQSVESVITSEDKVNESIIEEKSEIDDKETTNNILEEDDIISDSESNVDKEPLNELETLLEKLKSYANVTEIDNGEKTEDNTDVIVNQIEEEKNEVEEAIKYSEEENIEKNTEPMVNNQSDSGNNENEIIETSSNNNLNMEETKKINYNEILSNIDKLDNVTEDVIEESKKTETKEENEQDFKSMYEKIFGISVSDEKEEKKFEEIDADNLLSVFDNSENYVPAQSYKFIGIAFDDYIIIEMNDEMYIINSKSAYKRITFEKLKKSFYSEDEKDSQLLLLPDIITLTHREMEIARDNFEIFEKAGFIVEEFGENTVKLSGAPSICVKLDTKELFLDILDEINTVARTEKNEIEDKFLITVAENIVNKTKFELDENEANNLIHSLLELSNPFDFGRIPVTVVMNKSDIEKKFARRK